MGRSRARFALSLILIAACKGPAGPTGPSGQVAPDGPAEPPGDAGPPGHSTRITGAGLKLTLTDAKIEGTKATAYFKVTDGADLPLDLNGRYTEGAVTARFVLAVLDGQYTAYTTRAQTSPITGDTAVQASTDTGGTFTEIGVDQGTYAYELNTQINVVDPAKTHTVAVYATRPFGDKTYVDNAEFSFVPAGGTPEERSIVTDEACNSCHGQLQAHGFARREVKLCITCHSPQTVDPDTRNTVDMKVMIHKIHRGSSLPSVLAGAPYQIIGFGQTVADFSTVVFPQDFGCTKCHIGPQGDAWKERPNRAACGSCHDLTAFVDPPPTGFTSHAGGPQADDASCVTCHPSMGGVAGITDVHWRLPEIPGAPVLSLRLLAVTATAPGQQPQIDFEVKSGGQPRDITVDKLTTLRATVAGPTSDYATFFQATIQGSGASGTLTAIDAAAGQFRYVFPASGAISPSATGTYAFALEANLAFMTGRLGGTSNTVYAAVTDPTPVPHRLVVDAAKCDNCHGELAAHGGTRVGAGYCELCHNPENTNDERVARFESTMVTPNTVDLKVMIHKIHRGEHLLEPYVLGGNPAPTKANPGGNPVSFNEVRFPGDLRECTTCHLLDTQNLPLQVNVRPVRFDTLTCTEDPAADADNFCDVRVVTATHFVQPVTAVCTSCHDSDLTAAHADVNTTVDGRESCATCHSPGAIFDPAIWHQREP